MLEVLTTNRCPSREEWMNFYAGKIEGDSIAKLAAHLDTCSSCQALLRDIAASTANASDPLLARLRAVPNEVDEYQYEPACRIAMEKMQSFMSTDGEKRTGAEPREVILEPLPERLGEYRIIELLGRGGMGAVYRAVHMRLGREVALKVVSRERARAAAAERFVRETRAHGQLDHPNVVRATDAGEVDGVAFLVMELIDGVALDRLVRERGVLPVADACEIARQAAVGLQHLAEHGLVHRDVKPSNVMVNRRDEVKVLDLGLVAVLDWHQHGTALTDGQVIGTFDYLAPEQSEPNGPVDARTDIYGLGCTLYFLLTGTAPYPSPTYATARAKILAHNSAPIPVVTATKPDVPAELSAIITRMLAKDPADRFATPRDVAVALAPFCNIELQNAPTFIVPRAERPSRRPRFPIIAAVL